MLTATYTLVALSVEQTNLRVSLHAVQQLVQKSYARQTALTVGQAEYVCDTLRGLYESCQRRKLDRFLLPALRRASANADSLVAELDQLSRDAVEALATANSLLQGGIDSEEGVEAFCTAVERFCAALTLRFEREELELFPVARVAIAGETWFAMAHQMLAHDAYREEHRVHLVTPPASRPSRVEHTQRQAPPVSYVH